MVRDTFVQREVIGNHLILTRDGMKNYNHICLSKNQKNINNYNKIRSSHYMLCSIVPSVILNSLESRDFTIRVDKLFNKLYIVCQIPSCPYHVTNMMI